MTQTLPLQLTSFVGRQRELAETGKLLNETRLLTLTGPGGVGKTRLALELCSRAAGEYKHGAWLVELAGLADAELVPQSIGTALGVAEEPGRGIEAALADFVQQRELLVVLDNCEHLLHACARTTARLLLSAPQLKILATSREALAISGEIAWPVPPLSLSVPPRDKQDDSEAVQLFLERARAAQPRLEVSSRTANTASEICMRLDGMPLAIELAAARTRSLSLQQIEERLTDRFGLLIGRNRASSPRHQTLRALVDWSHDLLSEPERILLRRLSVFAGGWTLETAEAVCSGGELEHAAILDLLSQLIDKSLVVAEEYGSVMRYRLLETLRQYAAEKSEEAGEVDVLRSRHLAFFADFAERVDPLLYGADQAGWYDRLEMELGNVRAALDCSESDSSRNEAGLRLAGALWRFWFNRGHLTEGWERLARLLSVQAPDKARATKTRAMALNAAGRLGAFRCELPEALGFLEEALALYRAIDDRDGEAVALRNIGIIRLYGDDLPGAATALDQATELMRSLGGRALTHTSLLHRGWVAYFENDDAGAECFWQEALDDARRYGDGFTTANILTGLGYLSLRAEDILAARRYFEEALTTHVSIGSLEPSAGGRASEALEGLACTAAVEEHWGDALRLYGGAAALRRATAAALPGVRRSDIEDHLQPARKALGSRAAATQAEGEAKTMEELVRFALGEPAEVAAPTLAGGLTAREREIAVLVGEGLSNRQIAGRLVIAERTAETHVQHILNKLGFSSRAQVAAWAAQQGLLVAQVST